MIHEHTMQKYINKISTLEKRVATLEKICGDSLAGKLAASANKDNANIHAFGKSNNGRTGRELLNCHKPDCSHYKVCHEWASLGNENFINESNGNCDNYEPITDNKNDHAQIELLINRAYYNGITAMWDAVKKIECMPECGGYTNAEIADALGKAFNLEEIFEIYAPMEFLEKIKAYEVKQKS